MKTCYRCKEEKSLDSFYRHKTYGHRYECKMCTSKQARAYAKGNPEKARAWNRASYKRNGRVWDMKRHYGVTLEQYSAMYSQQAGLCKICLNVEKVSNKRLAIDHCHATGKVRGLLCSSCNNGLGRFKDNVASLENAIKYLKGEI